MKRGWLLAGLAVAAVAAIAGYRWAGGDLPGFPASAPDRDSRAVYPNAVALDWPDLIPREEVTPGPRLADGTAPRGLVQHGELGAAGALPEGEPSLPGLAEALGARNDFGGAPRRLSDSFGGFGNLKALQPSGGAVRTDLDGREVRIAGFVAPLAFAGDKITDFLLVPYVGACIHVPPPPLNQIVLVGKVSGFRPPGDLLYPVWVTGRLKADRTETGLATVGYRLEGALVEPYR